MLVFDGRAKPDYPERKTPQSTGENQQEVYILNPCCTRQDLNVGHNLVVGGGGGGGGVRLLSPLLTLACLGLGDKATKGSVESNMHLCLESHQ